MKFHWLDLVVVGLIITAVSFLFWQRLQIKTSWVTVQIKITPEEWWFQTNGPEPWYSQGLKNGDWGFNSFGEKVAQIENIQTMDTGSGKSQIMIWAKLKVGFNSKREQYVFGFQPIQIGKGLELDFGRQRVKGLVVNMENQNEQFVERTLRMRIAALDPLNAAVFFVGQQAKTFSGDLLATILELKISPSIESHYSDIARKVVLVENPQFVTLEAVVKVKLKKIGDQYFYADGQVVKLGDSLWIEFPQVVFPDARVIEWMN